MTDSTNTVSPHLLQHSWLEYEEETALKLLDHVTQELKRLAKKETATRVHDTRVALRRWDSVWRVLDRDGWSTKKYWKQVGSELQRIHKRLGHLRDWDVNIDTADALGVPHEILVDWTKERAKAAKKVRKELQRADIPKMVKRLKKFVRSRPYELRKEIAHTNLRQLAETAYAHLEPYLHETEEQVRKDERKAKDWEELHKLRLGVKAWRYFLTEFFGLTNLQLVRAQQILGKYNDFSRVDRLLRDDEDTAALAKDVLRKIESQNEQLLKEFSEFRKALPYGLRPQVVSTPPR